jgi:hypothetical protein
MPQAPRIEKPRKSSTSDDTGQDSRDRRGAQTTRRAAYRFDTVGVSLSHGPVLSAPYAAQVIGQALHANQAPPGSYRPRTRLAPALLLDWSL